MLFMLPTGVRKREAAVGSRCDSASFSHRRVDECKYELPILGTCQRAKLLRNAKMTKSGNPSQEIICVT